MPGSEISEQFPEPLFLQTVKTMPTSKFADAPDLAKRGRINLCYIDFHINFPVSSKAATAQCLGTDEFENSLWYMHSSVFISKTLGVLGLRGVASDIEGYDPVTAKIPEPNIFIARLFGE